MHCFDENFHFLMAYRFIIISFYNMAGHKRTRGSQEFSGRGVPISIPVIGTPIRPPLSNLNPNTPVLR